MNLPHTVILVTPATTTDRRGDSSLDYGVSASRASVPGWMQEQQASETVDDRDVRVSTWRLFSTATPTLNALQRVEWNGSTFEVVGRPNHLSTPRGYHHTEAELRLAEG